MNNTSKFKIGDVIKANEASDGYYLRTTHKRGWAGKVVDVRESGSVEVETLQGRGSSLGETYLLDPQYFDLVAPSNAQTFEFDGQTLTLTPEQLTEAALKLQSAADKARKEAPPLTSRRATVGDIVVTTSNECSLVNKVGDIGKIVLDDRSSMPYQVEVPGRGFGAYWEYEHCVRLATAEEIAKYEEALKPKLKVGDWVRNTGESKRDLTIGKAYKVTCIDTDDSALLIDDIGESNYLSVDDFEIIAEPTPFDRAGRKPNEFKKGDIVRVLDALGGNNESGGIVEVYRADGSFTPMVIDRDGDAAWPKVELVTPVESRVDIAEGADIA